MQCDKCIYSQDSACICENRIINIDDECLSRVDIEDYNKIYNKAIDDLCNAFKEDWDEQCENELEDCVNWYDWLVASAEQLKSHN